MGGLFSTFAKTQLQAMSFHSSRAGANSETKKQQGERCPGSCCLGEVANLGQEVPKEKLDSAFFSGLR